MMTINHQALGLFLLRLGLGGVFFWFGLGKLLSPLSWLPWIPPWIVGILPMSQNVFLSVLGIVELVVGALLLLGYWSRLVAGVAALQLVGILASFGFNEITTRDFGLLMMALALVLMGGGTWSLHRRRR